MIRFCLSSLVIVALLAGCAGAGRKELRNGAALYADNCAVCHGGDAQGGGGAGIFGLSKTPPDLTVLRRDNGGIFPVTETVATLEGYGEGGARGRQMTGFSALQSERRKRVRIDRIRVRPSDSVADLLVFLESVQRP